jgi:hypothetical protein
MQRVIAINVAGGRDAAPTMEDGMDGSTFDRLARLAATSPARRSLLRSGFAAVLAGLGATSLLGSEDAEAKSCQKKCEKKKDCNQKKDNDAKRKCKNKCKKKCTCIPKLPQAACTKSDDCCPDKTKYTCGTSHGSGSNTCCGTQGAICSGTLDCCIDQLCVSSTCVPTPIP